MPRNRSYIPAIWFVVVMAVIVFSVWALIPRIPFVTIKGEATVQAGSHTNVVVTVHKKWGPLKGEDIKLALMLIDNNNNELSAPRLVRVEPPTFTVVDGDIEWTAKAFRGRDPTFVVSLQIPSQLPSSTEKVCFLATASAEVGTSDDFCSLVER